MSTSGAWFVGSHLNGPFPADDHKQRQPDIALARETRGWEPTVPLDHDLEKTIACLDQILSSNVEELRVFTSIRK